MNLTVAENPNAIILSYKNLIKPKFVNAEYFRNKQMLIETKLKNATLKIFLAEKSFYNFSFL